MMANQIAENVLPAERIHRTHFTDRRALKHYMGTLQNVSIPYFAFYGEPISARF